MSYNYPPAYPPPPSAEEPLSTGAVLGMLTLGCLLPIIGPLIGIVFGIKHSRKGNAWAVIGGAVVLGLIQLVLAISVAIVIPNIRLVGMRE
jgi:hypothetical protein